MATVTIEWLEYKWEPKLPPSEAEYHHLRSLGEPEMKLYIKKVLHEFKKSIAEKSPYRYRTALTLFGLGVVMLSIMGLSERWAPKWQIVSAISAVIGLICIAAAGMHALSTSYSNDGRRSAQIEAREYYVQCWVVAQQLDYPAFFAYVTRMIDKKYSR